MKISVEKYINLWTLEALKKNKIETYKKQKFERRLWADRE